MGILVHKFAERFAAGWISAQSFSDAYIQLWRVGRYFDLLTDDIPGLNECLSTIFCLVDMYEPGDESRADYELGDEGLRREVLDALAAFDESLPN